MKNIILALLLGGASYTIQGQNISFSQYHLTPVYTSPAELGTSDYFQVSSHYRKQSLSQDQGFQNVAITSVYPLFYKNSGRRFGGLGLGVMSEKSGMLGMLQETSIKAGYAYNWQITPTNHMSFGIGGGYFRRNLNLGKITTDSQYQNGGYTPGGALGENFTNDVGQVFQVDAGATWYSLDAYGDQKFSLGVSAFNLNRANYKFLVESQEQALPLRYQLHGSLRALTKERIHIMPTFRYMFEKDNSQLNLGSLFQYQLQEGKASMHESHVGLGVWYSLDNAAIFSFELVQPSYVISLSYDLPASSNIQKVQVNNAVEVTLGWRLNRGKRRRSLHQPISELTTVSTEVSEVKHTDDKPIAQEPKPTTQKVVEPEKKGEVVVRKSPEKVQMTKDKLSPEEQKVLNNNLEFKVGSDELSPNAKAEMEHVVKVMKQNPDLKILLVGHTCTLGSEVLNKELSIKRAEVAKEALVAEGISPERVHTEGRFYMEPIASNDTAEGRIKNRRVEFKILE